MRVNPYFSALAFLLMYGQDINPVPAKAKLTKNIPDASHKSILCILNKTIISHEDFLRWP
jgi:hypothetical protein